MPECKLLCGYSYAISRLQCSVLSYTKFLSRMSNVRHSIRGICLSQCFSCLSCFENIMVFFSYAVASIGNLTMAIAGCLFHCHFTIQYNLYTCMRILYIGTILYNTYSYVYRSLRLLERHINRWIQIRVFTYNIVF